MQPTLMIIVIEGLLVMLIALIALLIASWRRKFRCHEALEHLVEDVKEQQELRSEKMVNRLIAKYKLDDQAARELSAALFASEQLFISQFVEQQLHESMEGFYDNLCALLDSYLKTIPTAGVNRRPTETAAMPAIEDPAVTAVPEVSDDIPEAEFNIDDDSASGIPKD